MITVLRASSQAQSRRGLCIFLVLLSLCGAGAHLSWGQESVLDRGPAPDSVFELNSPLDIPFLPLAPFPMAFTALRDSFRESLKPQLETLPPFFRDTQVGLNLRMYYFDRENHVSPAKSDNEALGPRRLPRVSIRLVGESFARRGRGFWFAKTLWPPRVGMARCCCCQARKVTWPSDGPMVR